MHGVVEAPEGAREQLAETVAALRRPVTYPGEVDRIKAIETHMAWVFLTERHAYKLKKPIRLRQLDHTTIEARRTACETELRLNRRLAAPVYLAVVPVADTDVGLRVDGDGPPVDWMVKMRRLPHEQTLEAKIERNAVRDDDIERLGTKLSAFYLEAKPGPWTGAEYRKRIVTNLDRKCRSLQQPRYGLNRTDIRAIDTRQQRWLGRHGELLERRALHVVDAHGDLRPEHVYLGPEPMIIDCLEFERTLRLLDPVSELSFLSLECRRLGAGWIGDQLFALYKDETGDDPPSPLIPFYESYHALVRAAIAIWHLDDDAIRRVTPWREQAEAYLHLAREL